MYVTGHRSMMSGYIWTEIGCCWVFLLRPKQPSLLQQKLNAPIEMNGRAAGEQSLPDLV